MWAIESKIKIFSLGSISSRVLSYTGHIILIFMTSQVFRYVAYLQIPIYTELNLNVLILI